MSAVTADRLLGALIDGRYRVDRVVGSGGFGTVYQAFHVGLGAPVALKVLALRERHDRGDSEVLARKVGAFLEEGRTLKRLHHPSIAAALDVGFLPDDEEGARLPYLVMAWCDGPTLKEVLDARGGAPMPLAEAWRLFEPLLDAAAHAHAEGVAHRDLKPGNVILEAQEGGGWRPRIIDFGIAKIVSPDDAAGTGATRTGSGSSPFTPRYAAPEQLAGARTGPWTDVHALALIFVELVTGRPAIDGDAELGVVNPVRPTPGARGVDVGALEPVLLRALALRPADRHADASALAHDMRAVAASGFPAIDGDAVPALPPPAPVRARAVVDLTAPPSSHTLRTHPGAYGAGPSRPPGRRRRWPFVAALSAVACAVALGLGARVRVKRAAAGRTLFPGRLRDVSAAQLELRVQALGLGVCTLATTPTVLTYVCPKGTVQVMDTAALGLAPQDVRMQVNFTALAWAPAGAVRYAIDGTRGVIVTTRDEDAEATLDALVGDDAVDLRARPEVEKAPPLSAAARSTLAAWTGTDLWAAAALVSDAVPFVYASTEPAVATIQKGDKPGVVRLHTQRGRVILDTFKNPAQTMRFAYAIEGDRLLMVMGDPAFLDEAFVRTLLGGARAAEVGVVTPGQ